MVDFVNLADIMGRVDQDKANNQRMQMNQLLMQRQNRQFDREDKAFARQDAIDNAFGVAMNDDGSINRNVLLRNIGKVAPRQAYQLKNEFASQDAAAQKATMDSESANLDILSKKAEVGRDMIARLTPENYHQMMAQMKASGFKVADVAPPQFDPQWQAAQIQTADSFIQEAAAKRKIEADSLNKPFKIVDGQAVPNEMVQNYELSKAKAGKATTNVSVNTGQKGFDNTLKLRTSFRGEPIYKAHQEVQGAYAQIKSALAQESPAGDMAGATKIMKLLDPGSVVRESELAMAMEAGGALDRLVNYAQMRINGTKLTPTQRKDFRSLADALYNESVKQFNTKREEYQGIATRNQLPEMDVLGLPGTEAKPASTVRKYDPATGTIK